MKPCLMGFALAIATPLAIATQASAATLFQSTISGAQTVPSNNFPVAARATFSLNEQQTALTYTIDLDLSQVNLKPNPADRTADNDINKIHLHFGALGGNGPHVLNIFGLPSEDDDDLNIDFANGIITGVWDDGDVVDLNGNGRIDPDDTASPGSTKPLSAFVDELLGVFRERTYRLG